ncbi:hypothetical protein [Oscillatoria sp. CS-180]|uniref:hypothetical protein n=1 Tax=Oscillatoria sp. CS-180 TaxID=3021720 RepID=UPI00232E2EFD|nr:hypothetical protein [Oscillatoria sp. CS-180]
MSSERRQALLAQIQAQPNGTVSLPNFDLSENTFQFSNSELVNAINLQRDAAAWEAVLTEQLEQLFGTQVCIGSEVRACVLTSAAKDWLQTQLERIDLGIGEGMAAAALSLWQQNPPQAIPWWQRLINLLVGRVVFGLARSLFELQTFIANLFLMQGVSEVFQPTQDIRETFTPTEILFTILDIFATGSLNPFTMGIYHIVRGGLMEGHALLPYQVENKGDGQYWVYVYDSNYPVGRTDTPSNLYVEFDTNADTWRYQPTSDSPEFKGDATSKNIDLTQLSWRQIEKQDDPPYRGPFTCPFCNAETSDSVEPTIEISLIGEGTLTVVPYGSANDSVDVSEPVTVVPFKGGLNQDVPPSYHLPAAFLNEPLQITLSGKAGLATQLVTLQLTGPGYTANFSTIPLAADETLKLYAELNPTGPALTFVSNQATELPLLSIHLNDDSSTSTFDSSTADTFSFTERQVAKSSEFEMSNLRLPAGKRVTMAAREDLKRLYLGDDDGAKSRYSLIVRNRIVIRDRIQVGERRPDFINYTLTYEEDLRTPEIEVAGDTQAYFDYDRTFLDPADKTREELLTRFEQRGFPITIAYEPLTSPPEEVGPLRLIPTEAPPIAERIFQSTLWRTSAE